MSPTISLHTPNIVNESDNIFSPTTYFSFIVGYKSRVASLFSNHYGVSTYKYIYLQFSKRWFENESFLDFAYQKDRNCVIHAVCLCSLFCVSERGKLCHTYSMCMLYILCIRKREIVSYLQYVYVLDFVY